MPSKVRFNSLTIHPWQRHYKVPKRTGTKPNAPQIFALIAKRSPCRLRRVELGGRFRCQTSRAKAWRRCSQRRSQYFVLRLAQNLYPQGRNCYSEM